MALVALACTGCARDGRDEPDAAVRDSAGVRIVETDPGAWPPPEVWRVSEQPTVEIGVQEGDPGYELFQVRGAVTLPNGSIVVAEFGSRLRYYDPQGRHLRTLERQGNGPGEAELFSEIATYRGDSLILTTEQMFARQSLTRLLILDADGAYGRDVMAWYPGTSPGGGSSVWAGSSGGGFHTSLDDGSLIIAGATRIDLHGSAGDVLQGRRGLLSLGPDGSALDTLAIVPSTTFEYAPLIDRKYELMLDEAAAPDVRSDGTLVYFTSGERFVVDVYDPGAGSAADTAARLVRSFRVHAPTVPSTEETRQAYIETTISIYSAEDTDAERALYRERLESLQSPDSLPALQDLEIDAAGNVWLEARAPLSPSARAFAHGRGIPIAETPSRWIVLNPEGRLLGSVLTPAGLEVLEIGDDFVLGLAYDSLGVQHVRRHRLIKP